MTDPTRRTFLVSAGAAFALSQFPALASADHSTSAATWTLPPPREFHAIENVWVPMRDGVRLSMKLWIPNGADRTPVPAVLESTPYGKRIRVRDTRAGWAAQIVPYGLAYAVPDIRGSGESAGLLRDEYLRQEQEDNLDIIAWLARQAWCNGSVGMRGVSWGGFSALEAAALNPPALKAVVVQCASDNRYTDDAHYIGGCVAMDGGEWAGDFLLVKAMPPDPEIVGEGHWRRIWVERLKAATPITALWLQHQRNDSFWQQGSVAVDYSRIRCPVYAIDGQSDPYRDFVSRLLTHLDGPRLGVIGPWAHMPPHAANPSPGLDWAPQEVRWWAHWLQGEQTGILSEPMLRAYVEDKTASEVWPRDVPGRWVAEAQWPSPQIVEEPWFLNAGGALDRSATMPTIVECRSQESIGLCKREWYIVNPRVDLAPDQRPDDEKSLTFDSAPLVDDFDLLGKPRLRIKLSSDQPVAHLAFRLNEVTPSGHSWNVSYGVLNLTHRNGHERPEALAVGKDYDIELAGYFTAHRFKKGNRIRVALSESLWPLVWPSPRPVRLAIATGSSSISLPVRHEDSASTPMTMSLLRDRIKDAEDDSASISQTGPDADGRITIHKKLRDGVTTIDDVGITIDDGGDWYLSIREGDPNSCVWRFEWYRSTRRGPWATMVRSLVEISSTPEYFHVQESVEARELDTVVFARSWNHAIKRDLV